ncbi:hypothetical protein [Martelella radicis]|uniref:Uncharacterized protein n=1 Tax=Martelella radicis TaxID=1397476 RepID=A0A7W6P9E0_9HYPH|nr:hypothetical protein [Martelella radicis]MBB4120297.1 hypothetical protein [Martelella radicis]
MVSALTIKRGTFQGSSAGTEEDVRQKALGSANELSGKMSVGIFPTKTAILGQAVAGHFIPPILAISDRFRWLTLAPGAGLGLKPAKDRVEC